MNYAFYLVKQGVNEQYLKENKHYKKAIEAENESDDEVLKKFHNFTLYGLLNEVYESIDAIFKVIFIFLMNEIFDLFFNLVF